MIDTFLSRLPRPGSQDGFMLIEVLVSSLLVALIAVATFNGFDVTQKVTNDERAHNQATVLAQQDEERLRGMSVSELLLVGTKIREVTEGSAIYKITSTAQFVSVGANNEDKLACATATGATANYIQTTSSVTWNALGKRKAVSQSAHVRVPTSTSLMVSVLNRNNEAVQGAKVEVFDPSTASTPTTEGTTPESGCMTFGGLAEGNVKIVASHGEWIDHSGHKLPEKTVTITGTSLAEAKFTLEAPGSLQVKFVSNGLAVSGQTFFALQNEIASSAPDYVGGSPTVASPTAELTNLFPFVSPGKPPTPNRYTVYAGDCEKNNPVTVTGGGTAPSVQVEPGVVNSPAAEVEVPPVNVVVWEGTSAANLGHPVASLQTAMIINTECKTAAAQNYAIVPYEHKVNLTSEGTIEQKYQPFAKQLEFCVVDLVGGTYYKYKSPAPFENKVKTGTTLPTVYLKETTSGYSKNTSKLTCP
jgi:Tfp pilus assembly protein PilV